METPREPEHERLPEPTDLDRENTRIRLAIAERIYREYEECLRWAASAFGPGWVPSCRHYLVEHEEEEKARRTGQKARAAATVYTVKNAVGGRRHFTVADGVPVECASYQSGFGPMLLEPHPTYTIEVRGQRVHPHRYSLCWAPFELYEPRTAEQLAALRKTRERRRAERKEKEWQETNPLLAWTEREEGS